jgi:hypothetical protein
MFAILPSRHLLQQSQSAVSPVSRLVIECVHPRAILILTGIPYLYSRQYPSFWGYAPARVYSHLVEETKKGTKTAMKVTHATGKQMSKETQDDVKIVAQAAEETEKETTDAVNHVLHIPTRSIS